MDNLAPPSDSRQQRPRRGVVFALLWPWRPHVHYAIAATWRPRRDVKADLARIAEGPEIRRRAARAAWTPYQYAKWCVVAAGLYRCGPVRGSVDESAVFRRLKNRAIAKAEQWLAATQELAFEQQLDAEDEPPVTVPFDDELFEEGQPERRAVPLDEAVAETLDLEARLDRLAAGKITAGERTFLAAWRLAPDASIAEIARQLGLAPATGRVYAHKLRVRAASL